MHDFALTQNLLCLALKQANAKRIVSLHLWIGPFSEEREESIRFYWRDLAKGSPGEGAQLYFEHFPMEMKCLNCSGTFYLGEGVPLCQYCFNERLQWTSGEDVRIEYIELEE